MTPERWARLKDVFGAAFELPEGERRDFVERTLASDPSLCEQVQRLLEAEQGPLENPLLGALAGTELPDLARGEMLGPYRVETKIGQGGMGVVYRAWDTRLDRRVALKVLRPEQVGDPVRRQYLVREARAASALVQPNIVAVYDIGSDRDIDFIAMEHVEGRPLQRDDSAGGAAGETGRRVRDSDRASPGVRTPGGRGAPRSEAREYHDHARGHGQAVGLRPGAQDACRRRPRNRYRAS